MYERWVWSKWEAPFSSCSSGEWVYCHIHGSQSTSSHSCLDTMLMENKELGCDASTCDNELQGIARGWPHIGTAVVPAVAPVVPGEVRVHRTKSEFALVPFMLVLWQRSISLLDQWKSIEQVVRWTTLEGNAFSGYQHMALVCGEDRFVV